VRKSGESARDPAREYHAHTDKDVTVEAIRDRMGVSRDILDKHYDKRSEEVKLEQRRGYLENI
jgi:hypothetical protein